MKRASSNSRWILPLAFVLVLSLMLSACGTHSAGSGSSGSGTSASSGSSGSSGSSTGSKGSGKGTTASSAPFKISIMADLHTPNVPTDKVLKVIEQKTNTQLNITWVPDDNYDEKMNTAIATNSMPMAMFIKNQASFGLLKKSIREGAFWEIGPYIKDFPHLAALNQTVYDNTKVDGKLYSLFQARPLSRQGLIYRKDWADKLGLSKPQSIDDIYNMAKAFTTQDPDGNNKNDTIGLADRGDLIYGAFKTLSSYFGTPNNWGMQNGKLEPEFMFPQYIQTMDFMKKLRDAGYINKDFPVTSKKDQQDMFENGKAGMYIGAMDDVLSLHNKAVKINPKAKYELANVIKGPDGTFHGVWSIPGYGSLVLFPKSSIKDVATLKKVLGFFDYLASGKGYNYLQFGIEGVHYTLKDGVVQLNNDPAVQKLQDADVRPLLALEIGDDTMIKGALKSVSSYDIKNEATKLDEENAKHLLNDPTAPLESATFNAKGPELQKIITDATYKYMLGNIDKNGFQKAIDQWKAAGGDKVIQEFNASYQTAKNNQ